MIVSIKSKEFNLTLPIPLFMGSIIIRCIPKKQLNPNQKKVALQIFKAVKKQLKYHKGLKLLEVIAQDGEHITVTI